jgi:hypothetical protein
MARRLSRAMGAGINANFQRLGKTGGILTESFFDRIIEEFHFGRFHSVNLLQK